MENKTTYPILTKYERAAVLAARAQELTEGAPTQLTGADSATIARLEFETNTLSSTIKRLLPNGTEEVWTMEELQH
jgi:DNA-directed RNA polymerase subunit K/omega